MISLDYMWMKGSKGDSEEVPKGNPILVMHCRDTKLTWSRVVLRKGVDPYSIKGALGHGPVYQSQAGHLEERRGVSDQSTKGGSKKFGRL